MSNSERFDAMTPRKRKDKDGNEKTYWHKIGAAWFGNHKQIVLDSLPIPDADGRCVIMLFEPKEPSAKTEPEPAKPAVSSAKKTSGSFNDMDDDIPF